MKLEDQVCSLELAKQLKRLGVKQSSLFFWEVLDENAYGIRFEVKFVPYCCPGIEKFSAFTVSELLDMLPNCITIDSNNTGALKCFFVNYINTATSVDKKDNDEFKWQVLYSNLMHHSIFDSNLANACAKMLIYLIENNIWKSEQ